MSDQEQIITDDLVVSLEYVLQVDEGREVSRSDQDNPMEYIHGHGQIIPALEQALHGLAVGDEKEVLIAPDDGYGEHNPDEIVEVPRNTFPPTLDLKVGEPLSVKDSQTGESFRVFVVAVHEDSVELDFNHPLAGKTLNFQVKILGVRNATVEELSHGHVHGEGNAH